MPGRFFAEINLLLATLLRLVKVVYLTWNVSYFAAMRHPNSIMLEKVSWRQLKMTRAVDGVIKMKGFNFHILKASEVSISKLFRDCLEYEELICTAASRTIYAVFSTRQPFDIPSRGFSLIMLQIFRYHMVEFSPFPKNNSHTTASFLRMAIWPAYNCRAKLEFVFRLPFQNAHIWCSRSYINAQPVTY